MKHVRSGSDHIRHIKPRNESRDQPNEIRIVSARRVSRSQSHFEGEPKNSYEDDWLHGKPSPTQSSAASLLHQLENGQMADLLSPLPMVFQYRRESSQEKLLAVQTVNNLINCKGNKTEPLKRERIYSNCGEASTVDGSSPASTTAISSVQVSGSS